MIGSNCNWHFYVCFHSIYHIWEFQGDSRKNKFCPLSEAHQEPLSPLTPLPGGTQPHGEGGQCWIELILNTRRIFPFQNAFFSAHGTPHWVRRRKDGLEGRSWREKRQGVVAGQKGPRSRSKKENSDEFNKRSRRLLPYTGRSRIEFKGGMKTNCEKTNTRIKMSELIKLRKVWIISQRADFFP